MLQETNLKQRDQPTIQILTVREAAKILKVNQDMVRRLIREKKLEASRVGRLWRIRLDAIEEFLAVSEETV